MATGKDLKGTGVWSFIKVQASPASRAAIAATIVAIVVAVTNPSVVSALTSDASVNSR